MDTIFDRWEITPENLTKIVDENPSLRGMLFGYVAEFKLTQYLDNLQHVSHSVKYDDHDRTKKGDRVVIYKGHKIIIESKSIQTNTIVREKNRCVAKAQVDASDRRLITLPDGSTLNTTLLLAGQFDVLAVNIYAFENQWRFVFAKNDELPRSRFQRYSQYQREHLLASLVPVTWPPEPPFHEGVTSVLDEIVREREAQ